MEQMIDRINRLADEWGSSLQAPLMLAIRLLWGYFFVNSGIIKLGNLPNVAEYFAEEGIPFPMLSACLTGGSHLFCGLALMVGFMSRIAAIPLGFTMVVAYLTVHSSAINPADPVDFLQALPFLFLYACLLVIAFGPGKWSVDHWLSSRKEVEVKG